MGYVLDEKTIRWARMRNDQLQEAETEIGCAIDRLAGVPGDLRGGALLMDDQPESDMMRSYADDIEKTLKFLNKSFAAMKKDRAAILRAIHKYNDEHHEWGE